MKRLVEKGIKYDILTADLIQKDIESFFDEKGFDVKITDNGLGKGLDVKYTFQCEGKDLKKVKSGDLDDYLFSENGVLFHNMDFGTKIDWNAKQITISFPNTSDYNESKKENKVMAKKLKKYYLYAGYYELFISGHELKKPYVLLEEFDTMEDALDYAEENYGDTVFFTQDVIDANPDYVLFNDENWKDYLFEEGKKITEKKMSFKIGDVFANKDGLRIKIIGKEKYDGDTYETIEFELLDDDAFGSKKGDTAHLGDYELEKILKKDGYEKLNEGKKSLKEALDKDTLFAVEGDISVYEDSYEDGEGKFVNAYDLGMNKKYTLKELMKEFSYFGFSDDPKDYMFGDHNGYSEIVSDCMQNKNGDEPTKDEIEAWKKDEIILYNARLSAHIYEVGVHDVSFEDAKEIGFDLM